MEMDGIYLARQRDSYHIARENNALLREALLVLRLILARLDSTGPMPTSYPSSVTTMAGPTTAPTPLNVPSSSLKSAMARIVEKGSREVLIWVFGKLGLWLYTLVLPTLVSFGALAWMKWLMPLLKQVMG